MDVVKHIKHVTSCSPFPKKEIPCSLAANRAAGAALPPLEKKSMQPGCKPQLVQPTARLRLVQPCWPALD